MRTFKSLLAGKAILGAAAAAAGVASRAGGRASATGIVAHGAPMFRFQRLSRGKPLIPAAMLLLACGVARADISWEGQSWMTIAGSAGVSGADMDVVSSESNSGYYGGAVTYATPPGYRDAAVQEVAISFHDDVSIDHGTRVDYEHRRRVRADARHRLGGLRSPP